MRLSSLICCCSIFILMLSALSCKRERWDQLHPPNLFIKNFDPKLRKVEGIWFYDGQLFSGYMVEVENDKIIYKLPIIKGKENGLAVGWYNSGEKLMERVFINGLKEGQFKQWWPNGNFRYIFNFKADRYQGTQLVHFPDGSVREQSNYLMGKLEGQQKVWNEDHELISNYTIKNNKIYGIRAVKSCMPVEK